MLSLKSTLLRQRLRMGKENIIALGIVAFLIMNFWSLYSMSVNMNTNMFNCPFMNGSSSFCQMSIFDHVSRWQQFFLLIREKAFLLSFPLLMLIFLINPKISNTLQSQRLRNHLYRYKPEIKLFDYLIIAFAQGIIHSKIYA